MLGVPKKGCSVWNRANKLRGFFFRRQPGDGTHSPMVKAAGKCRPLVENNFTISAYQNVRYWH